MKRVIVGILVIAAIAFMAYASIEAKKHEEPMLATVKVLVGEGHGSGVDIGNGYIVTAAHVVIHGGDINVIAYGEKAITKASLLWANRSKDIALLKVPTGKASAPLYCGPQLAIGSDIEVVGNPMYEDFVSSYGKIAGLPRKVGVVDSVYVIDSTVVMGQSGGPVLHNGKVVGIVSMVMTAPLKNGDGWSTSLVRFGYAVPSSVVCELMGRG